MALTTILMKALKKRAEIQVCEQKKRMVGMAKNCKQQNDKFVANIKKK